MQRNMQEKQKKKSVFPLKDINVMRDFENKGLGVGKIRKKMAEAGQIP